MLCDAFLKNTENTRIKKSVKIIDSINNDVVLMNMLLICFKLEISWNFSSIKSVKYVQIDDKKI